MTARLRLVPAPDDLTALIDATCEPRRHRPAVRLTPPGPSAERNAGPSRSAFARTGRGSTPVPPPGVPTHLMRSSWTTRLLLVAVMVVMIVAIPVLIATGGSKTDRPCQALPPAQSSGVSECLTAVRP